VENEYATLRHDFESMQRRSRRQLEAREQQLMEVESKLRAANQQNRDLAAIETTLRHELAEWRSRGSVRHLESLESELIGVPSLDERNRYRGSGCAGLTAVR
jgi:hypothetical protein